MSNSAKIRTTGLGWKNIKNFSRNNSHLPSEEATLFHPGMGLAANCDMAPGKKQKMIDNYLLF